MLLDTQVVLWLLQDSDRLGSEARSALVADPDPVVSTASLWEVAIKRRTGKVEVPDDLPDRIARAGIGWLPVTSEHAWATQGVALPHRDPFDRLLVAQAVVEGVSLLTADRILLGASPDGVTILDARV
jgi:PIN domain nuclease of toxin-antitoxin system